jgi:hypothetical protein
MMYHFIQSSWHNTKATQMHLVKTIDKDTKMGGLVEEIITLVLILQLQQALVRQQRVEMMLILNQRI